MARKEVQALPRPARHRAHELASSRVAATRSEAISLPPPAQTPRLQPHASVAPKQRRISATTACRRYRRDHCRPLPPPAADARHKRESSAGIADYRVGHRAKRKKLLFRKSQMRFSTKKSIHES